ncbi:MAG: hypothetical protein HYU58_01375 [Proteobacteria bacterium]|nr:hypothetical protein [Pseudomonadota bacterium]
MAKRPFDGIVDEFAERLKQADVLIGSTDHASSIEALEGVLGRRFPRVFASLIKCHAFKPFTWGTISFFGSSGKDGDESLSAAVLADEFMWRNLVDAGFVQFARPWDDQYDPVCFDIGTSSRTVDARIVRIDHEAILNQRRTKVLEVIAPSFVALLDTLLSGRSQPTLG